MLFSLARANSVQTYLLSGRRAVISLELHAQSGECFYMLFVPVAVRHGDPMPRIPAATSLSFLGPQPPRFAPHAAEGRRCVGPRVGAYHYSVVPVWHRKTMQDQLVRLGGLTGRMPVCGRSIPLVILSRAKVCKLTMRAIQRKSWRQHANSLVVHPSLAPC